MNGYRSASRLDFAPDARRLVLAVAEVCGPTREKPGRTLFSGPVERGDVVGAGLLALADVARSSYSGAAPPEEPPHLDPVVTVARDRLRFESLSACNGVYARFDLVPERPGEGLVARGTTLVDVGAGLCAALARLDRYQPLHLTIGDDQPGTGSSEPGDDARAADLPDRWVRAFSELPTLMRGMGPRGELVGPAIAGFVATLPRGAPPGPLVHVVPLAGRWVISSDPVPGSVPLPGASRVQGVDRVLRLARRLRLHAHPDGCSAWELELPGARLTLVLTSDVDRGFRGDGALLDRLTGGSARAAAERLVPYVAWSSVLRPEQLLADLPLTVCDIEQRLSWLAVSGRLGYDLAERAWFHRDLPVDSETALRDHPLLVAARRLVEQGAVLQAADGGAWLVRDGEDTDHDVHAVRRDDEGWRCECGEGLEHGFARGPCRHVAAVLLSSAPTDQSDVNSPPSPDTLGG